MKTTFPAQEAVPSVAAAPEVAEHKTTGSKTVEPEDLPKVDTASYSGEGDNMGKRNVSPEQPSIPGGNARMDPSKVAGETRKSVLDSEVIKSLKDNNVTAVNDCIDNWTQNAGYFGVLDQPLTGQVHVKAAVNNLDIGPDAVHFSVVNPALPGDDDHKGTAVGLVAKNVNNKGKHVSAVGPDALKIAEGLESRFTIRNAAVVKNGVKQSKPAEHADQQPKPPAPEEKSNEDERKGPSLTGPDHTIGRSITNPATPQASSKPGSVNLKKPYDGDRPNKIAVLKFEEATKGTQHTVLRPPPKLQ